MLHGFNSRFKSLILFELIFVCVGVKRVVQFPSLARDYSVFSSPFVGWKRAFLRVMQSEGGGPLKGFPSLPSSSSSSLPLSYQLGERKN